MVLDESCNISRGQASCEVYAAGILLAISRMSACAPVKHPLVTRRHFWHFQFANARNGNVVSGKDLLQT